MDARFSAMKKYQQAYREHADLIKNNDELVEQQRVLLPLIAKAEAAANKAREAMLLAVQANDAAKN
jgi:hypothetical protein